MSGLVATGTVVRFGGLVALDGVDLEAPTGRITGLIGPNGAGKTTMFNVCCGFQPADEGTVTFNDVDVTKDDPASRARMGIGRTFQRMELFRSLTVRENVELGVESLHVTSDPLSQLGLLKAGRAVRRQIAEETERLLELTGLNAVANRRAGEVSTGQGRLVEIARALARKPRLLLLDEPSSGLDAKESAAFGELLVRLMDDRDFGILMIEHDMSLVLNICEWISVLDFGKPLMAGTPADIRRSEAVRDAYLGKEVA
jgi:ABC-type branched-subunit amino acid transport system ATPase component